MRQKKLIARFTGCCLSHFCLTSLIYIVTNFITSDYNETSLFSTEEKKKVLQLCWDYETKSLDLFRFGPFFGRITYYIGKHEKSKRIGLIFYNSFMSTKIGNYIYSKIISNPWE